jgi:mannosyltransferase OCH1-like enzyme
MIPKLLLPRNEILISNPFEIETLSLSSEIFTIILYYIHPYQLQYKIRRIDSESGWNPDIKLKLWSKNSFEYIDIGSSIENEKIGIINTQIELEKLIYKDQLIPKNIIQTYHKDTYNSKSHYNAIHSFIDLNPEYTYYYFNDNDCRNFIKSHFELRILMAYDKIIPKALKSDIFRICFIYINGGCYFDHKQILMKPLREWIQPHDKYVMCDDEPELWMHNGIFASIPKSEHLYNCLLKMIYLIHQETFIYWADLTGPRIFYDYTYMLHRPLKVIKGSQFKEQRIIQKSTQNILLYRCYFTYYQQERNECYDTLYRQKKLFYKDIKLVDEYIIYRFPTSFNKLQSQKKTKKSIQNFTKSIKSIELFNDSFDYKFINKNELQIYRTDSHQGWNFDLILYLLHYKSNKIKEYKLGSSTENSMILHL